MGEYANTTVFYVKDLNICGFGGILEPVPHKYQGMTLNADKSAEVSPFVSFYCEKNAYMLA